jgi:hypothetical protein
MQQPEAWRDTRNRTIEKIRDPYVALQSLTVLVGNELGVNELETEDVCEKDDCLC